MPRFWESEAFRYVVRQVLIALLLALLTVLGYDRGVAVPRLESALAAVQAAIACPK
ncbi:MAG: hypothetical protein H5T70_09270 [Chloroflexi bacterium]|nr:hypothetical protein [Chloroflexota bacterium]